MRTLFTGLAVGALLLAVSLHDPAPPLPDDTVVPAAFAVQAAPLLVQDTVRVAFDLSPVYTADATYPLLSAAVPTLEPVSSALVLPVPRHRDTLADTTLRPPNDPSHSTALALARDRPR